jgi:hypothetical protein
MSIQAMNAGNNYQTTPSSNPQKDSLGKRAAYGSVGALATAAGCWMQFKTFSGYEQFIDKVWTRWAPKDKFCKAASTVVKDSMPKTIVKTLGLEAGSILLLILGFGALGRAFNGKAPQNPIQARQLPVS